MLYVTNFAFSFSVSFSILVVSSPVFVSGRLRVSTCPPKPVIEGPGSKLESKVIASRASGTTDAYRRSFW